jgi:hypothetical protein
MVRVPIALSVFAPFALATSGKFTHRTGRRKEGRTSGQLVADAPLQFPDAQSRQEQAPGPFQPADHFRGRCLLWDRDLLFRGRWTFARRFGASLGRRLLLPRLGAVGAWIEFRHLRSNGFSISRAKVADAGSNWPRQRLRILPNEAANGLSPSCSVRSRQPVRSWEGTAGGAERSSRPWPAARR